MILVRTTEGQKYQVPTDDEDEAIRLVGAFGVPENHILMLERNV
ncbi:MAG TPA: hypothetical protein VLF69_03015 [Candidatus Saccharimonadales bacterium]|nr:hypothetical protein [Candidatus Saccharimonadales bacterium]